jgi:hypothetical protein
VRVQVGGRFAGGLGGSQLGGDHVDHGVCVLDEGRDRQRRIGQREREVGRVEDAERAALGVGGQRLGQDHGDDVARVNRVLCLFQPPDPRHAALAELGCQVLHAGEQKLFLRSEVVLHQP